MVMKKIVPVFPWPMPAKLAQALEQIEGITPVEALPGGPGPIIAIKRPTFICDAIMVTDPARLNDAVNLVIGNGLELVSMRRRLGEVLGEEVSETTEERVSKVRFQ